MNIKEAKNIIREELELIIEYITVVRDMGETINVPRNILSKATKELVSVVPTMNDTIPVDLIFRILEKHDLIPIQEDGTAWSGLFSGQKGRADIELAYEGKLVKNATLQLQWYELDSGRYEINVYVA